MGVARIIQGSFKVVSRNIGGCFEGVSRVFPGYSKGVSRKFQRCFMEVLRVFQGSSRKFGGISRMMGDSNEL